jgi:hypothetical protein
MQEFYTFLKSAQNSASFDTLCAQFRRNFFSTFIRGNALFLEVNPLPHGVLATFSPTAGGLMGLPKKDDISREKTILMTSLRTHRASAVSSPVPDVLKNLEGR